MNISDLDPLIDYLRRKIPDATVLDRSISYDSEIYYPVIRFEFDNLHYRSFALTRELWDHTASLEQLIRHMERFDWIREVRENPNEPTVLGQGGWFDEPDDDED